MTEKVIFETKLDIKLVQLAVSKKYLHLLIDNSEKDFIPKSLSKKSQKLEYISNGTKIEIIFARKPFQKQHIMTIFLNSKEIKSFLMTKDHTLIDTDSTKQSDGVFIKK